MSTKRWLAFNPRALARGFSRSPSDKLLRQEALELNNKSTKASYGMVVILLAKFSVLLEVKHMFFWVILHTANQGVKLLWTAIRPQPLYTITLDIPHHGTTKGIRESIVDFKAHTHSN